MPTTNTTFIVQPKRFGHRYRTKINGVWGAWTDSSGPRSYGNNTVVGFSDQDYRTRILKRQDASHAYKRVEHTDNTIDFYSRSGFYSSGPCESERFDHAFCQNILTPVLTIPSRVATDDIALKRLKQRLAGDISQFKSLIPLAELKETRSLVRTTAQAASEMLRALIEIKSHPRNVLSKASKVWLQYSFAISPTVNDTINLVNSIGSYLNRSNFTKVYYGKAEEKWDDTFGNPGVTTACAGHQWILPAVKTSHHYQVQYTAGINFDLRTGNNYGLTDHFGLTFGDLPSLAWELIPFSWVVDYFTTVGAFLEDTFSANAGNTFYCTKSQKYNRVASIRPTLHNTSYPFYWTLEERSGTCSAETFIFERTVLSQLPHRAMRVKTVDEIGIHSVNKLLNLASVLLAK